MNERIKELRKLAERYTLDIPASLEPHEFDEIFDETFAELIVKECVGIVAKRKDQAIDDGWNVDEAMSMAEMDLEEHFGIKA